MKKADDLYTNNVVVQIKIKTYHSKCKKNRFVCLKYTKYIYFSYEAYNK